MTWFISLIGGLPSLNCFFNCKYGNGIQPLQTGSGDREKEEAVGSRKQRFPTFSVTRDWPLLELQPKLPGVSQQRILQVHLSVTECVVLAGSLERPPPTSQRASPFVFCSLLVCLPVFAQTGTSFLTTRPPSLHRSLQHAAGDAVGKSLF